MIRAFIDFTEFRTKITSIFTFLWTLLLLLDAGVVIDWGVTVLFFMGMLLFDLTTTAINNTIDALHANTQPEFSNHRLSVLLVFVLLGSSTLLGLWLFIRTDWVVLIAGMISFALGIAYTWGPAPISRQPYGEVVSAVMYGYMIPFILIYVNMRSNFLSVDVLNWQLSIALDLRLWLRFLLLGLVPGALTATIMLGNNLRDLPHDPGLKRYTLPYYIGQPAAIGLLKGLLFVPFGAVVLGVLLGWLPWLMVLSVLVLPRVLKHATTFVSLLPQPRCFAYIIKNFITIGTTMLVLLIVGHLI